MWENWGVQILKFCPNFSMFSPEKTDNYLAVLYVLFPQETETRDQQVSPDEKGVSGGILYLKTMAFVIFCFHLVNVDALYQMFILNFYLWLSSHPNSCFH